MTSTAVIKKRLILVSWNKAVCLWLLKGMNTLNILRGFYMLDDRDSAWSILMLDGQEQEASFIVPCKTNEMEPIEILCTESQAQDNSAFLNGKNTTKCISRALFVWSRPLLRMDCLKRLCLMHCLIAGLFKVSPLHYNMCTAAPWIWEQKQNNREKRLSLLNPNDFHSFSKMCKYLTMENIKSNIHNIWIYNYRRKETFYTLKAYFLDGNDSIFTANWNHWSLVMVRWVKYKFPCNSSATSLQSECTNKVQIWYKNPSHSNLFSFCLT